jgi:tRNA threonylcarbamoyl adenosine modification protein YeaZ
VSGATTNEAPRDDASGAGQSGSDAAQTLVIDCATPALSVALFDADDACIAAHHSELGRGHAEALLPTIAALPAGGRAKTILVNVGPGSFTGVRVGVAAAVALGFAWGAPVRGYGCLDLVAAMARTRFTPRNGFPVVMIGGHGELFWSLSPAEGGSMAEPLAIHSTPIAELAGRIDAATIYGSGAAVLIAARESAGGAGGEAIPLLPDARCVPLLAPAVRDLPPRPVYGRGADARPMADAPRPDHPARTAG